MSAALLALAVALALYGAMVLLAIAARIIRGNAWRYRALVLGCMLLGIAVWLVLWALEVQP